MRLLPLTGAVDVLVDMAAHEYFHEVFDPVDLKAVLEEASNAEGVADQERFWILDALALWDWQRGKQIETYRQRVARMEDLASRIEMDIRGLASLANKKMHAAAADGDIGTVDNVFREALRACSQDPATLRIVQYSYAVALLQLGRDSQAADKAQHVSLEYYDVLNLDPLDMVGLNPEQIIARLDGGLQKHQDNLKHLADCLDVYAKARRRQGVESGLANLHAMKFYVTTGAYRSALRVGLEAADAFLTFHADATGARKVIETFLLPLLRKYGIHEYLVPVRALYAVSLAYCGEAAAARDEIRKLEAFAASLTGRARDEFENQVALVDKINQGLVILPRPQGQSLPPSSDSDDLGWEDEAM